MRNPTPSPNAKVIFQTMLMSDLHLEYNDRDLSDFPVVAPYLILAGDIGRPDIASLEKYLLIQCQRFEHIFYVAGNHCFYEGEYEDRLEQLYRLNNLDSRIHFLQSDTYLLPNKIRILGTILWSHIPEETASHIEKTHADYRRIERVCEENRVRFRRKLTVNDTNQWHTQQHFWLLQEIDRARQNHEHVIIITHHAPSRRDTCLQADIDIGHEHAYINDLEAECLDPVRLWVYGHTHRSTDMLINSTRVVSNQLGYQGENCGYRPNMCICLYDDGTVIVNDKI
ncbi:unnamed protein product [Adineta ricciae]|uniref:Calcineurin-like phosphoesterase domain-containing protein n=1 Tax=Adineta ricciae TaxID=249248 RepID=A0A813XD66_ADIRI|nr:unnamed protein product [Adineta ricciae]CAF1338617.1 unnamed protein product [Adineta ricciae]